MRFGSSVIGRFAFARACDPMIESASKRFGCARVGCRRNFAYRAKQSHSEESSLMPESGLLHEYGRTVMHWDARGSTPDAECGIQ